MARTVKLLILALLVLPAVPRATAAEGGPGDVTVVAVIDSLFVPYHWDFLASKMPQALDADPGNDLPLDDAPHAWLPGFPDPSGFSSYEQLDLTLEETEPNVRVQELDEADAEVWSTVEGSTPTDVNYYWIPGTKVIGALDFGATDPPIHGAPTSHGTGTTSVSVGNLHGTCPECLLVFISYDNPDQAQAVLDWAESQPWIDVVSNSYGINLASPVNRIPQVASRGVTIRDQVYLGPVDIQRAASERGQTIFFSAGNGIENGFITPHTTYTSSIKGPDWVITVGAVAPEDPHDSYSGAGKPVDIAGVGNSYPSAYAAPTVGGSRPQFSGTSNASPTVAGTYARALYLARRNLAGPSRLQAEGVVAVGAPYACGSVRPDCELGDGVLTAVELRTRLLEAARHTPGGTTVGGVGSTPPVGESDFLQEGHGSLLARLGGEATWLAEFERLLAPLEGRAAVEPRPAGEREWMTVDSYCRQKIWGSWDGGYYRADETALPGPDPAWPIRSALEAGCLGLPAH